MDDPVRYHSYQVVFPTNLNAPLTKQEFKLTSHRAESSKASFVPKNKGKKDPLENSGVYRYHCSRHKIDYIGETKRSFRIRDGEHKKAAEAGRWSHSGLTQHMEHCDAQIEGPFILTTANRKDKNPKFDLRVNEALNIKRYDCGPGRGMNEDHGSYVTTTQWQPVFNRLGK